MVLRRKKIPPRLDNSTTTKEYTGNDRPSTTASLTHHHHRRRAPSSSIITATNSSPLISSSQFQNHHLPHSISQESIFSPDLNTSPAFDLMPLEQAQKSPIASSPIEAVARTSAHNSSPTEASHFDPGTNLKENNSGISSDNKALDMSAADDKSELERPKLPYIHLQSNNPFLKEVQQDDSPRGSFQGHTDTEEGRFDSHTTDRDSLSQSM